MTTPDIKRAADLYATSRERCEQSWTLLRHDKFNPRFMARYIRDLRRSDRLKTLIKMYVEIKPV